MGAPCQAQLLAEAAGTPVLIPDDMDRVTHTQVGSPVACYFSFQPLWGLDHPRRTRPFVTNRLASRSEASADRRDRPPRWQICAR